ncbi:class F sortase [Streptomyces sp. CB03911]|nr:class F sortase [Streptomyces sp. CB03911]
MRRRRLVAATVATTLATGVWLLQQGLQTAGPPPAPVTTTGTLASPASGDGGSRGQGGPPPLAASEPVRIKIPAIRVDAPVSALGLDRDQHLSTPPTGNKNLAGWYRDGPSPGAAGNAITIGHADTDKGPAVFYRLGLLRPGDRIEVTRRDRTTAVFSIDAVKVFPKNAFPDATVYGPTARPELRVITCGGAYDKHTGYRSNTVVFSHLTATR